MYQLSIICVFQPLLTNLPFHLPLTDHAVENLIDKVRSARDQESLVGEARNVIVYNVHY